MSDITLEHFQIGKLDNEITRHIGADFEIVAMSPGLTDIISSPMEIAHNFSVQIGSPALIEGFSGAYGWYPWNSHIIIIARFERSPTEEYAHRSFFIQAHYAIVSVDTANELGWDLRPLFDLLPDIPRRNQFTELMPLTIDRQNLKQGITGYVKEQVINCIPLVFQNAGKLLIFDGNIKNPIERLNCITELVACFPPRYRVLFPFVTSVDPWSPISEIYQLAFSDEQERTNYPEYGMELQVSKRQAGGEYYWWLKKHMSKPVDSSLFRQLRLPVSVKKLDDLYLLDYVVSFSRRWRNLRGKPDHDLSQYVPNFLEEYSAILTKDECEAILIRIVWSTAHDNDLPLLASSLIMAHNKYSDEVFSMNLIQSCIDTDPRIISSVIGIMRENEIATESFLKSVIEHLKQSFDQDEQRTAERQDQNRLGVIKSILGVLGRNKQRYPNTTHELLNILIEYGYWPIVWELVCWKNFEINDFYAFNNALSGTSRSILRESIPATRQLLEYLVHKRSTTTNDLRLLIRSYEETSNLEWLFACLVFAIEENSLFLLAPGTFQELENLIEGQGDVIHKVIEAIRRKNTFRQIASVYSTTYERGVWDVLEILRDFLFRIKDILSGNPQTALTITIIKLSVIDLFLLLVDHMLSKPIESLIERDRMLDEWAEKYYSVWPKSVPKLSDNGKLSVSLVISAMARAYNFPQHYNDIVVKWVETPHKIDVFSLYVWLVMFDYQRKCPEDIFGNPPIEKDVSEIISKIINTLRSCRTQDGLAYIIALSQCFSGVAVFSDLWLMNLAEIPMLPLYEPENWDDLAAQLERSGLQQEADSVNTGTRHLRKVIEDILSMTAAAENTLRNYIKLQSHVQDMASLNSKEQEAILYRWSVILSKRGMKQKSNLMTRVLSEQLDDKANRTQVVRFLKDVLKS